MSEFRIRGGKKLNGEITISGSKNAAAGIVPATLLTNEDCVIRNVPRIGDVLKLISIIEKMGASVEWEANDVVRINTANVDPAQLDYDLMGEIRMSILLIGPLLVRFGSVEFVKPGGCAIGARPINTHIEAFEALGAVYSSDDGRARLDAPNGLTPASFLLREMSVTATENAVLAAARIDGEVEIRMTAAESHVTDLLAVLEKMGVEISGKSSHHVVLKGKSELSGFDHSLVPDPIETGTFMVAGAIGGAEITLKNVAPETMQYELKHFEWAGVDFDVHGNKIVVRHSPELKGIPKVQSMPYPGFSADLLAPFALLMTQAKGTTLIHETLFESRIENYIPQLQSMGADAHVCDPHRALVTGPSKLCGKKVISADLRAGATLILAALIAEGETVIENSEQIDRGYVAIDEKLKAVGADISRA